MRFLTNSGSDPSGKSWTTEGLGSKSTFDEDTHRVESIKTGISESDSKHESFFYHELDLGKPFSFSDSKLLQMSSLER